MNTRLLILTILLASLLPTRAIAQDVHLPIVGRQLFTAGLEVQGGAVVDYRDELGASLALGPRARIGIHHIVSQTLSMNAEFSAGATYFAPHIVAPEAQGPAQTRFDWRVSLLARRQLIGPTKGWTFGGGIDFRQAHLIEGTLIQFGLNARLGRFLWTDDERFLIVELALHGPLFEGLDIADYSGEVTQTIPAGWIYPSASLAIQWAF